MTDPRNFTDGEVITVKYPFLRDVFNGFGEDTPTWVPGCRYDLAGEDAYAVADGEGQMVLTVVCTVQPGKYPTRVFFTRRFISPDGVEFGKPGLKMATREKFRRLCKGYRDYYDIEVPA